MYYGTVYKMKGKYDLLLRKYHTRDKMMEDVQWKEELNTYYSIKSMFILEGNIQDKQMLTEGIESGELVSMNEYLYQFFKLKGYHSIVFFNRIDGFYNNYDTSGKDMEIFINQSGIDDSKAGQDIQSSINAIRATVSKSEHSSVIVMELAGQLIGNAEHLSDAELEYLSTLQLAIRETTAAKSDSINHWANNLIILLVNKAQELPTWFYRYSPYIKVINVDYPKEKIRRHILSNYQDQFVHWSEQEGNEKDKVIKQIMAQTDGFTCVEMDSVLNICCGEPINSVLERIRAYKHGRKENPWLELGENELNRLFDELSKDVIGQPRAVRAVTNAIYRAASGLSGIQHSSDNRPKAVLMFAGPTGTGKTELAKSLARNIFGLESSLVRFDMSEYSQEHSDQRLMGAPPGYVGYDAGGELTNAVREHPFSILLFDEIEKAHPTILDKFLQILDDGRMTDSRGETVYFSECIIVFTSNLGMSIDRGGSIGRKMIINPSMDHETIESTIKKQLRKTWRMELLNRIGDNIIVFDYIREEQVKQILNKQITQIIGFMEEKKDIRISVPEETELYKLLLKKCYEHLEYGGRGVGNVLEHDLITPLGRELSCGKWNKGDSIVLKDLIDDNGELRLIY